MGGSWCLMGLFNDAGGGLFAGELPGAFIGLAEGSVQGPLPAAGNPLSLLIANLEGSGRELQGNFLLLPLIQRNPPESAEHGIHGSVR